MKLGPACISFAGVMLAVCAPAALAQGGPPFRTDDPDTPGNRQWEVNLGLIGDRNPYQGSYALPNFDVNYGLGDRIQLKMELPLNLAESRVTPEHVGAGLGNFLFGFKWRFYEQSRRPFALSLYPQLVVNSPTRSVDRGIVEPGPQLLLPLEANTSLGPIRVAAELGYWFTSKNVPNSWIRGVMVGHEFRRKTELYLEFYDQQEVDGTAHQTTLGIGGRRPITKAGHALFIAMLGHGLRAATHLMLSPIGSHMLASNSGCKQRSTRGGECPRPTRRKTPL